MPVIVSDTTVEIIPPATPRPGGEPLAPSASRRYQRWLAAQRWFAAHLLWIPATWSVSVDLSSEAHPTGPVRINVHPSAGVLEDCTPEAVAEGVARLWRDVPTGFSPSGPHRYEGGPLPWYQFALTWLDTDTADGEPVEVTVIARCLDGVTADAYRAALVDAGILRADVGEGGVK